MNKKTIAKIILDTLMLFMVLLLYNKRIINLTYHEVSGLILMFIFVIHIGINYKWVSNMAAKFFSKNTGIRSKIIFVVDFLLLISFLVVGISGILISKEVFHFGMNNFMAISWETVHLKFAAFSLVLLGIHLGLHAQWIKGIGKRFVKLPALASKILLIVVSCVFVVYGVYSTKTTSFSKYITVSLAAQQTSISGLDEEKNSSQISKYDAVTSATKAVSGGDKQNLNEAQGKHEKGEHGNENVDISTSTIFNTIASYFSIVFLFSCITAVLDWLVRHIRRKTITA